MRNIKFYISMVMVIGLISLSGTSFAEERLNIDVECLKNAAMNNTRGGQAEVKWNARVKNNTDEIQTYEIKVKFLNNQNEYVHETAKIATFRPNEIKVVSQMITLETSMVKDIESGYVSVSKLQEQNLSVRVDKNIDMVSGLSDKSVDLAYTVKLKNNTDKAMTRIVTVKFFDEDNNHVKSETKKTSFSAGESKMISDKLEVSAADAGRIAKGHITIN
ncbi:MAG: hypothetical protein JXL81_02150 [Deltaproteobacteria bacterium]|nr:hypothetical protein [Deltaproteobacteria bacterium]